MFGLHLLELRLASQELNDRVFYGRKGEKLLQDWLHRLK